MNSNNHEPLPSEGDEQHIISAKKLIEKGKTMGPIAGLTFFKKAVELSPDLEDAVSALRSCYEALLETEEGDETGGPEEELEIAIALDEKDAWARCYLGHLLIKKGKMKKAYEQYDKAIEIDPKLRGIISDELKKQSDEHTDMYSRALELLNKVVEYNSEDLALRNYYETLSKKSGGEEGLRYAIAGNGKDALAHFFLGEYYRLHPNEEGGSEQSEQHYEVAVAIDSNLREEIDRRLAPPEQTVAKMVVLTITRVAAHFRDAFKGRFKSRVSVIELTQDSIIPKKNDILQKNVIPLADESDGLLSPFDDPEGLLELDVKHEVTEVTLVNNEDDPTVSMGESDASLMDPGSDEGTLKNRLDSDKEDPFLFDSEEEEYEPDKEEYEPDKTDITDDPRLMAELDESLDGTEIPSDESEVFGDPTDESRGIRALPRAGIEWNVVTDPRTLIDSEPSSDEDSL